MFQHIIDKLIEKHNLKYTYACVDYITVTGVDQNNHEKNLKALLEAANADGFNVNDSKSVLSMTQLDFLGYLVLQGKIKLDPMRLKPLLDLSIPKTMKELKRSLGMFLHFMQDGSLAFRRKLRF